MEVDEETVIHIHDGRCWLPARVSTQIADYIAEGFVFVCVLIFSICLHLGNIEVGDIVQLHRTLGSPHNLAIVMFFCITTRADDHFKLLFKKLCIVSY